MDLDIKDKIETSYYWDARVKNLIVTILEMK